MTSELGRERLGHDDDPSSEDHVLTGQESTEPWAVPFDPDRRAGNDLVGRFDFAIDYGYYSDGDGELWYDPDSIAFAVRKAGGYLSRCQYRVVATTAPGRPDVAGWSTTSLRETTGFQRHTTGTAVGGGALGASLAYYTRTA
ncbi:hypothetical protein H6H00_07060 [Pseudonocardia petroleophila]|uniref:Bacterial HORMA domain-containing protein n=1 Tax=Pseudonocardia petroleophila TaxID=37331 RepID=A0A7G7MRM0_9PSEU|nr:hypothetical protein H6H00_07060 [Pseudonocardia petroleophila]